MSELFDTADIKANGFERHMMLLQIRKEQRDLASLAYGDDWRAHVPWRDFWSAIPSEAEAIEVEVRMNLGVSQ